MILFVNLDYILFISKNIFQKFYPINETKMNATNLALMHKSCVESLGEVPVDYGAENLQQGAVVKLVDGQDLCVSGESGGLVESGCFGGLRGKE